MNISVRTHLLSHLELYGRHLLLAVNLLKTQYPHAILDTDNRPAAFCRRERDHHLLARFIEFLIGLEAQHHRRVASFLITSALITRPIKIALYTCRMSAFLVSYRNKIGSPFLAREREAKLPKSIRTSPQRKLLHRFIIGIGNEICQSLLIGIPPPIPIQFIDLDLQLRVGGRTTLIIDRSNLVNMLLARIQLILVFLRGIDSDITSIGRIDHPARVHAEIAGTLINLRHETAQQESRRLIPCLDGCVHDRVALLVERSGYQFALLDIHHPRRIVEDIIRITIKRRRRSDESSLHIVTQVLGHSTLQPLHMQAGVQGLPTQNTFLRHIEPDL